MALLHGISVIPDRTDVGSATKGKTGQDFFCHHHENQRDGSDAMPMILLHITHVHKGEGIHHYEKKDSCL